MFLLEIIVGILCSIVAWAAIFHGLQPKIEFEPFISITDSNHRSSTKLHRILFRNRRARSIIDVEIHLRFRTKNLIEDAPHITRNVFLKIDNPRSILIGEDDFPVCRGFSPTYAYRICLQR